MPRIAIAASTNLSTGSTPKQRDASQPVPSRWTTVFTRWRRVSHIAVTRRATGSEHLDLGASSTSSTLWQRGSELSVRATHVLAPILINSVLSVGVAWVSAVCYSLGNIFSQSAQAQQSHRTFLIAILLWIHVFYSGTVWLGRSLSLFHLHLLSRPQSRAGMRMLLKMLRRTFAWFVFSGAAVAGVGYGCGRLDDTWRKYRPEMYTCTFWYYTLLPVADRAARHIYRNETIEGQRQQEQRHNQQEQRQNQLPRTSTTAIRSDGRRRLRWLSTVFHSSVVLFVFVVPIVYVHSISFLGVEASTRFATTLTVASLAFKIAMQEVTKVYIFRAKIRNARTMALLVALPTVMIDTQVRVVMLRFQSVQLAVSTTIALAVFEVVTRVSKAWWRKRKLLQRVMTVTVMPTTPSDPSQFSSCKDLEEWRAQQHKYHATELSANMYAEYLAIGCSSVIIVVFGDHPQFLLRSETITAPGSSRVAASLLAQVAIEFLVDFVSCVVELASGLEVQDKREQTFFLIFFAGTAVFNINASALLYLAY